MTEAKLENALSRHPLVIEVVLKYQTSIERSLILIIRLERPEF